MRNIDFSDAAAWYVPDIDGNRDDPEPFAVLMVPLTGAAVQALERVSAARAAAKPDESEILARVQLVEERTVRDCVLEVVGYTIGNKETGKLVAPKNGAELVEAIKAGPASERGIMRDISNAAHSRSKMTEGAKKKLTLAIRFWSSGHESLEWRCGEHKDCGHKRIRNCDSDTNANISWPFAPDLRRCPWAVLDDSDWLGVRWWLEWQRFRALPWGGQDLNEQPGFVGEAIRLCDVEHERIEAQRAREQARKVTHGA